MLERKLNGRHLEVEKKVKYSCPNAKSNVRDLIIKRQNVIDKNNNNNKE